MHLNLRWDRLVTVVGLFLAAWSCAPIETEEAGRRTLVSSDFGSVDGEPVTLFTLTNQSGAQVGIIEYGGLFKYNVGCWYGDDCRYCHLCTPEQVRRKQGQRFYKERALQKEKKLNQAQGAPSMCFHMVCNVGF